MRSGVVQPVPRDAEPADGKPPTRAGDQHVSQVRVLAYPWRRVPEPLLKTGEYLGRLHDMRISR
jgi:hypothetical protein